VAAEGDGVVIRNMNDRMIVATVGEDVAIGTFRVTPIRSFNRKPPRRVLHRLRDARFGLEKNEKVKIRIWK
jgi:hypothetical protein